MKGVRPVLKPLKNVDDAIRELKANAAKRAPDYREKALKIHGHICARCGKEFPASELHLLTVHHKDSDSGNNPPDGSNWENLCVYCHEAEHSRELLGDYEDGRNLAVKEDAKGSAPGLGTFADLFARASRKK